MKFIACSGFITRILFCGQVSRDHEQTETICTHMLCFFFFPNLFTIHSIIIENNSSLNYNFLVHIYIYHTNIRYVWDEYTFIPFKPNVDVKKCPVNRNISRNASAILFTSGVFFVSTREWYMHEYSESCWLVSAEHLPNNWKWKIWITNKELIHSSMNTDDDSIFSLFFTRSSWFFRTKKLFMSARQHGYEVW